MDSHCINITRETEDCPLIFAYPTSYILCDRQCEIYINTYIKLLPPLNKKWLMYSNDIDGLILYVIFVNPPA